MMPMNVLVTAASRRVPLVQAFQSAIDTLGLPGRVIATDVNEAGLSGMAGIEGITTRRLDVLDDEAVAALVGDLPPLQVLFNCAGYVHHGTILDCSADDWTFSMNLNVRAMYVTIRAALPKMLAHHEASRSVASIVNMASISGSIKGLPNRFVYGTPKAAVIGLTKSVAADYVQRGIRCNAIAPGTVDTPSLADRINAFADPAEARRQFVARQPMGRLAKPEEIAPMVVFLASDEAAFVTGNVY